MLTRQKTYNQTKDRTKNVHEWDKILLEIEKFYKTLYSSQDNLLEHSDSYSPFLGHEKLSEECPPQISAHRHGPKIE